MPLYSYKCILNEHFFEVRQSFADDPIKECPECGAETRKVISSVGVVFKGSGFYVTDSRKNGRRNGSSATVDSGKSGANESKGKVDAGTSDSDSKSSKTESSDKSSSKESKNDKKPVNAGKKETTS